MPNNKMQCSSNLYQNVQLNKAKNMYLPWLADDIRPQLCFLPQSTQGLNLVKGTQSARVISM